MPRILAVDDDLEMLGALRLGLESEGCDVEVAGSGEEALALARERYPDLVILAVTMPGTDGLAVLDRLRAADARLPVLLLAGADGGSTTADEIAGLRRGADDYVRTPCESNLLLARVQALLRRRDAERPPVLQFEDLSLDTAVRRAARGGRNIELTNLEFNLLRCFLLHPRRVLKKALLLARVWGYDSAGTSNVLEACVMQLRQKLEAAGEPRLLHTVRRAGYVLCEP